MGDITKRRKAGRVKKRGSNPFEQPDAVPTFLDPEWDGLEEAEADVREAYRGRGDSDDS